MKEKRLTKKKGKADSQVYYIPDEEDTWKKGESSKRRTYDHMDDDDYDYDGDDGKDYDDQ